MSYTGSCLLAGDELSGTDFRPNVTPYAGLSSVSTIDFTVDNDLQENLFIIIPCNTFSFYLMAFTQTIAMPKTVNPIAPMQIPVTIKAITTKLGSANERKKFLGQKYKFTATFNIQEFEAVKGSVETVREEVYPGPTLV